MLLVCLQMSLGNTPVTVVQLPGGQFQVQGVIQSAQSSVIQSPQAQNAQVRPPPSVVPLGSLQRCSHLCEGHYVGVDMHGADVHVAERSSTDPCVHWGLGAFQLKRSLTMIPLHYRERLGSTH